MGDAELFFNDMLAPLVREHYHHRAARGRIGQAHLAATYEFRGGIGLAKENK